MNKQLQAFLEADAKRTQGMWSAWPISNNISVVSETDKEKFLEFEKQFKLKNQQPELSCPDYYPLISINVDSGGLLSSDMISGKGLKKDDANFIALASTIAPIIRELLADMEKMGEALYDIATTESAGEIKYIAENIHMRRVAKKAFALAAKWRE